MARVLLCLLSLAAAGISSAAAPAKPHLAAAGISSAAAPAKPNLIFLLLDDMDHQLGAIDVMPETQLRLRAGGTEFTNAFVSTPKCCPSRTSLLSGRFAHRLDDTADGWCGDFLADARYNASFPVGIKAQGYRTAFFGKMVNSMGVMCDAKKPLVPAGFDVPSGDAFVAMCDESSYYNITFNRNGVIYETGDSPSDYLQAFLGNETLPWLARAASAAAAGGPPFFAYLAPHAPHFPAEPAPWYMDAPLPSQTAPRPPSFDAHVAGKVWAIEQNPAMSPATIAGVDRHFRNRHRALLSVDDYVRDIFAALDAAGVTNNTFVIFSSDHGYHLGEWRLPFEKSTPYDTDTRVPFFVRGPGVPAGAQAAGLVSLLDVGATLLELAGAAPAGARTTDGRSLVPLLAAAAAGGGGAAPAGWRDRLLIEHLGEKNQWMTVCGWVFGADCPPQPGDAPYLIDGPQNTWASLRVINATHDWQFTEFRPVGALPSRAATNWTEFYDVGGDPWQRDNLAPSADPRTLAALRDELWSIATCAGETCP